MKRREHNQRMALTILLSGGVFVVTLGTLCATGILLFILYKVGLLQYFPGIFSFFFTIAAFSLVGGTLLTAMVGMIPLQPVNKIINAMNRLASGDFKTRLSFGNRLSRFPPIQELTDSFNTMASELEGTEVLRSDFINHFSHEFKTPIVSIAGFAALLKQGNLPQEEQQEYLTIIENESRRLAYMATNVLNMTKVENQTILTDVSCFNLSEQLRRCVLLLESKWEPKNLEMNVDFREYTVCASEKLLEQVWVNLIENAVKFSPEYGTVEITVAETDGSVSVRIFNTGSYIPEELREAIFHKFYQADHSHSTEGHGIGLAVVKRVVELHGGNVAVESTELGTAFTVTLPQKQETK